MLRGIYLKAIIITLGFLVLPSFLYAEGEDVVCDFVDTERNCTSPCTWDYVKGSCRAMTAEEKSVAGDKSLVCGFLTDSVTCTSESVCVWDNATNGCRGKTVEELEGREQFFSKEITEGIGNLNPTGIYDVPTLIGRLIKIVMQIVGSIALLMFIYGGVLWMIDAGNSEKQKLAMKIIVWSSLGIIVILASYILTDFAFEAFR